MLIIFSFVFNIALAQTDFQSLKQLIQENKIQTVEQLLPKVSDKLRSQFTLVHTSDSLQKATVHQPRVIMYNDKASFVMTFNATSNDVEVLEFNETSGSFRFSNVEFQKGGPQFNSNNVRCLQCHSTNYQDAFPIWEQYPLWQGVYGTFKDMIADDIDLGKGKPSLKLKRGYYLNFKATAMYRDRYKNLIFPKPYYNSIGIQTGDSFVSPYTDYPHNGPNFALGHNLSQLGAIRIARMFQRLPDWQKNKENILLQLTGKIPLQVPAERVTQRLRSDVNFYKAQDLNLNFTLVTFKNPYLIKLLALGDYYNLDVESWFFSKRRDYFYNNGLEYTMADQVVRILQQEK